MKLTESKGFRIQRKQNVNSIDFKAKKKYTHLGLLEVTMRETVPILVSMKEMISLTSDHGLKIHVSAL
jgi:hypothetical protein